MRHRCAVFGLAAALVLVAAAKPSDATLLLYEPFDYPTGPLAGTPATGLNLTGNYTSQDAQLRVVGGRLAQNQPLSQGDISATLADDIVIGTRGQIFFSALVVVGPPSSENPFARISFVDDATNAAILLSEVLVGANRIPSARVRFADGSEAAASDPFGPVTEGQSLLLFGRYLNSSVPLGDRLELVAYDLGDLALLPTSYDPDDPNAEYFVALADRDLDVTQITRLRFDLRNPETFIDQVRIGTTYLDVVPEPGMPGVFAACLFTLGLRRRRTRR
jgi:hypothetical protein